MPALTAADLLARPLPVVRERVETPELGEDAYVVVRSLTGFEREQWERQFIGPDGKSSIVNAIADTRCLRTKLCALCLCDDQGEPLFREQTAAAEQLERMPARVLDRIYTVALRLCGLAEESLEAAEKNSVSEPNSATGSDSPAT